MSADRIVTGLFRARPAAEGATEAILRAGYTAHDLSVVLSDPARNRDAAGAYAWSEPGSDTLAAGTNAAAGAGIGSAVGGAVGAVLAAMAAVGTTFVVPGLGVVIAGPIAAALAGAGAGGATGGLLGALVGAGIPEPHARALEVGVREGGILLTVHARSDVDADMLERLMVDHGAVSVRQRVRERTPELA